MARRHEGKRIPGRLAARRIRRRPAGDRRMKVYHHRMRDGVPVVWREDGPSLRLMAPVDGRLEPDRVAVEILADAIGRRRAWPLAADFSRWLGAMGTTWDLSEGAIWLWVAGHPDRDGPGA